MNKKLAVTTPQILSYLAGFVDGDGSITIIARNDGKKTGYRPKLTVYNCNPKMVQIMNTYFGAG